MESLRAAGTRARRPLHVRPQPEARRPLPEVRLLAALPHRDHVASPVERASGAPMHWTRFSEVPRRDRAAAPRALPPAHGPHLRGARRRRGDPCGRRPEARRHRPALGRRRAGRVRRLPLRGRAPKPEAAPATSSSAPTRPGASAAREFDRLLDACDELAAERGLSRIVAGVNPARHEAYRQLLERGFRTDFQGVAMHRPNEAGYNRPGVFLIDDWR